MGSRRVMKRKLDMEAVTSNATVDQNVIQRFRKVPPAHYTFEIESFSTMLETKLEKYESKDFEAGGYKWRMVLYPNGKNKDDGNRRGKKMEDGNRYISLFLGITEPNDVSLGWEVNVAAIFFVFDGIRDRYLAVQDAERIEWHFHQMKMEWGFNEFLSHDVLHDLSNGFLVDDRCIFGVEVFVIKKPGEGESLSFVKEPADGPFPWTIENFSSLNKSNHFSEVFTVEGRKWKLEFYPNEDSVASGTHLSVYLNLDDSETLQTRRKVYTKCVIGIKDNINGNHYERECDDWLDSSRKGWDFPEFMLLGTLKDPSKGYLVSECMTIEVKFILVSVIKDYS